MQAWRGPKSGKNPKFFVIMDRLSELPRMRYL